MLDLIKYSEQELEALSKDINKELLERRLKNFPYKVGDCFCEFDNANYIITRIDSLDKEVNYTAIHINKCLDRNKYTSSMSYNLFLYSFKNPIDPKIFDIFSESDKVVSNEKSKFVKQMLELRHAEKESK